MQPKPELEEDQSVKAPDTPFNSQAEKEKNTEQMKENIEPEGLSSKSYTVPPKDLTDLAEG